MCMCACISRIFLCLFSFSDVRGYVRTPQNRVAKHPLHSKRKEKEQSPGTLILATPPQIEADFSRPRGGNSNRFVGKANRPKAQRFPQNPEAEWGPKARARHAAAKPTSATEAPTAEAPEAALPPTAPGDAEEAQGSAEPASKKAKT